MFRKIELSSIIFHGKTSRARKDKNPLLNGFWYDNGFLYFRKELRKPQKQIKVCPYKISCLFWRFCNLYSVVKHRVISYAYVYSAVKHRKIPCDINLMWYKKTNKSAPPNLLESLKNFGVKGSEKLLY